MGEPNTGFCEMEMERLTGAFENADWQGCTFDSHFLSGGSRSKEVYFTNRRVMVVKADAALSGVCEC